MITLVVLVVVVLVVLGLTDGGSHSGAITGTLFNATAKKETMRQTELKTFSRCLGRGWTVEPVSSGSSRYEIGDTRTGRVVATMTFLKRYPANVEPMALVLSTDPVPTNRLQRTVELCIDAALEAAMPSPPPGNVNFGFSGVITSTTAMPSTTTGG